MIGEKSNPTEIQFIIVRQKGKNSYFYLTRKFIDLLCITKQRSAAIKFSSESEAKKTLEKWLTIDEKAKNIITNPWKVIPILK